jgi:glycine C-acetyltransferase
LWHGVHGETSPTRRLLDKGVYVIGFSFPVVPKGLARIRTQVSAAHAHQDLDFAVEKFAEVSRELGLSRAAKT